MGAAAIGQDQAAFGDFGEQIPQLGKCQEREISGRDVKCRSGEQDRTENVEDAVVAAVLDESHDWISLATGSQKPR